MKNETLLLAPREQQITIRVPERLAEALTLLQAERGMQSRTDVILFYLLKGVGDDWDFSCATLLP